MQGQEEAYNHAQKTGRIGRKTSETSRTTSLCLRATARLVGAALTSDVEVGFDRLSPTAPDWVLQAERIRTEMGVLQEKLTSLKECVHI